MYSFDILVCAAQELSRGGRESTSPRDSFGFQMRPAPKPSTGLDHKLPVPTSGNYRFVVVNWELHGRLYSPNRPNRPHPYFSSPWAPLSGRGQAASGSKRCLILPKHQATFAICPETKRHLLPPPSLLAGCQLPFVFSSPHCPQDIPWRIRSWA